MTELRVREVCLACDHKKKLVEITKANASQPGQPLGLCYECKGHGGREIVLRQVNNELLAIQLHHRTVWVEVEP